MEKDSGKLNQVGTPVAADLSDVVSLFEQVTYLLVSSIQLLIWQLLFFFFSFRYLLIKNTISSLHSASKTISTSLFSYLRCVSALQIYVIICFMGILITFSSIRYHIGLLH